MMKPVALARGIRWAFMSLVAVWIVTAAAATPAAAEIFEGDLFLFTQTQIDDFAQSGVTQVTGNVVVWNIFGPSITNLDGLSSLTSVGKRVVIFFNFSLTDVDGLSALTSVGEGLQIRSNISLTDVDGLSALTSVGGELEFLTNISLTDVDGLSALTSVGGELEFLNNLSLTDVDGLSGLTSVGEGLSISSNFKLTDVDGLSGLTSLGGDLFIAANSILMDVDGLSGLTSLGGDLLVCENDSLTEFCGLYPLLATGGLAGGYTVEFNAANPTAAEILDGGPCDPADTIQELFDEGAINAGEATALLQLADNTLEGLANTLMGFVESGILTPSEAQLLFVIASNFTP